MRCRGSEHTGRFPEKLSHASFQVVKCALTLVAGGAEAALVQHRRQHRAAEGAHLKNDNI